MSSFHSDHQPFLYHLSADIPKQISTPLEVYFLGPLTSEIT